MSKKQSSGFAKEGLQTKLKCKDFNDSFDK